MSDVIKAPKSCANAIPTKLGWKHPTRNEILVKRKFTQAQIDAFFAAIDHVPAKAKEVRPEPLPEVTIGTIDLPGEEAKDVMEAMEESLKEDATTEVKKSKSRWPFSIFS
jgi:hypothetical protein